MPHVTAVLETVLYVADLDRAATFYREVMQLEPLFADGRMRAFDVAGRGVLLLFVERGTLDPVTTPGGVIPPHDGAGPMHLAFSIAKDDTQAWRDHLARHAIAIEGTVDWPRGAHSLYFRDPDSHLLELATPGLWQGY